MMGTQTMHHEQLCEMMAMAKKAGKLMPESRYQGVEVEVLNMTPIGRAHLLVRLADGTQLLFGVKARTARLGGKYSAYVFAHDVNRRFTIHVTRGAVHFFQSGNSLRSSKYMFKWDFTNSYAQDHGYSSEQETPVIHVLNLAHVGITNLQDFYPVEEQQVTQPQRKDTMHEINIAALMRQDTYTVGISHGGAGLINPPEGQVGYTYVTNIPGLKEGDMVVVKNINGITVGQVVRVDEGLNIEPGTSVKAQWVMGKVDLEAVQKLEQENAEIEQAFKEAYQNNMRRTFRDRILGELTGDALAKLPAAVKGTAGAPAARPVVDAGPGVADSKAGPHTLDN